jgi:inhibitor of cysteine peptidase
MVQKEVRKKTTIYGTAAILAAVLLISMVYTFGSTPTILPNSQNPVSNNSPGSTITPIGDSPSGWGMKTFSTIDELKTYIKNNTNNFYFTSDGKYSMGIEGAAPVPAPAQASPNVRLTGSTDYSTTNIQVQGVDEADTVKTDGQYIYTISNPQNVGIYYYAPITTSGSSIYILNADPQNAKIVAKITLEDGVMPIGLYLSPDSTRLAVVANKYTYPTSVPSNRGEMSIAPFYSYEATIINVYDITNKANPTLSRSFMASGSYFNSRLIGGYLYAVTTQSAMIYNDAVTLPAVYEAGVGYAASPTSIYYAETNQSDYFSFTSFYGIDIMDNQRAPTNMTVLMSGASTMYVSTSNIYVAYPDWRNGTTLTAIYRVSIDGLQLAFQAQGTVPGYVMDQYSMDEYKGNLRVATNQQQFLLGAFDSQSQQTNNLYVLNQNLSLIGKIEGIGQGENLHAVRFMGERAYMVTFIKTDPLFVIDLSSPENPKVLGELKMPGYSDYLHPYDATHLIGVGKDAVSADEGNFAWYQGLKLALFDVSNVNNPVLLANYTIGNRGTNSAALNDPKAFLFDLSKNILVIPVDLAIVNESQIQPYPNSFPAYGEMVWQGAYVFSLSPNSSFTLKGTVTHINATILNNQGFLINPNDYYTTQNQWISRSLYIGNILYTVSNSQVQLNSLNDLSKIATINLN